MLMNEDLLMKARTFKECFKDFNFKKHIEPLEDTYIDNATKMKFRCTKHNIIFLQTPKKHKLGFNGCKLCSKELKSKQRKDRGVKNTSNLNKGYIIEHFLKDGNLDKIGFMNYFDCKESYMYKKIKEFNIKPNTPINTFLKGYDGKYIVYLVKLDSYYKIGITRYHDLEGEKIKRRFKYDKVNVEVLSYLIVDNHREAITEENKYHNLNKENRFTWDKLKSGNTEMFYDIITFPGFYK